MLGGTCSWSSRPSLYPRALPPSCRPGVWPEYARAAQCGRTATDRNVEPPRARGPRLKAWASPITCAGLSSGHRRPRGRLGGGGLVLPPAPSYHSWEPRSCRISHQEAKPCSHQPSGSTRHSSGHLQTPSLSHSASSSSSGGAQPLFTSNHSWAFLMACAALTVTPPGWHRLYDEPATKSSLARCSARPQPEPVSHGGFDLRRNEAVHLKGFAPVTARIGVNLASLSYGGARRMTASAMEGGLDEETLALLRQTRGGMVGPSR
jgi:hypothetical protein